MEIEILVVAGCANEEPARVLVQQALASLAVSAPVTITVVADERQARERAFTGSPTILVDGTDPFVDPRGQIGLACRLYQSDGRPSGTPSLVELVDALQRVQAAPPS